MKNNISKANNLQVGRIYINAKTGQPCRLMNIIPCSGVWLESYDGQGYGQTISFDDCLFASLDEVEDFLQDLRTFKDPTSVDYNDDSDDGYLGDCYIDQMQCFAEK